MMKSVAISILLLVCPIVLFSQNSEFVFQRDTSILRYGELIALKGYNVKGNPYFADKKTYKCELIYRNEVFSDVDISYNIYDQIISVFCVYN